LVAVGLQHGGVPLMLLLVATDSKLEVVGGWSEDPVEGAPRTNALAPVTCLAAMGPLPGTAGAPAAPVFAHVGCVDATTEVP
jgi:hypothetical protein